jgi:uncharacterized RDD family membrane protein YckC
MESTLNAPNESEPSLLSELDYIIGSDDATVGQRFVNRLIDAIVIYGATRLLTQLLIYLTVHTQIIDVYSWNRWFFYFVSYLITVVYYVAFEGLSKGRTIGKFCTGTKVVEDNPAESPATAKDALLRTLVRLVPFNGFSAFGGHPWHDRWTHTKVIQIKK